jgi:transcriptional regulator with XRE-family HTH domain
MKKIIENLRTIRELNGLSQEQTAELLCKTQSSYARIERGATKIDLEILANFAQVMKMDLIDVITFPEKYVNIKEINKSLKQQSKTFIQIELNYENKDALLKLLEDNNLI